MKTIDLTGQLLGDFLVLKRDPQDYQKWIVKCGNGHVSSRYGKNLRARKALPCSECTKDKIPTWMYTQILHRMEDRFGHTDSDFTLDFLLKLYFDQNKECALSGMPISFDRKRITASLDRIDSSVGYVVGNVQWVHKEVNFMKQDMPAPRFGHLCELVSCYKPGRLSYSENHQIARTLRLKCSSNHTDYKNMIGKKFGELTVIGKHLPEDALYPSHYSWVVQCSCGNTRVMPACYLTCKGRTKCKACASKARRLNGNGIPSHFYSTIRAGARKRDLKFDETGLSKKWLFSLYLKQNKKCALTGLDITFAETNIDHDKGKSTASLDRIDSSMGYVQENVQWVHKDINMMKQGFLEDYFKSICQAVASHTSLAGSTVR